MKHSNKPQFITALAALIAGSSPALAQPRLKTPTSTAEADTCNAVQTDRTRLRNIELLEKNEREAIENGQAMLRLSTPNTKLSKEVADNKRDSERYIQKLQQGERAMRARLSASFPQSCRR